MVVGVQEGQPVYLRDVAAIVDGPEEPDHYVLFGMGPAAAEKGLGAPPAEDAGGDALGRQAQGHQRDPGRRRGARPVEMLAAR